MMCPLASRRHCHTASSPSTSPQSASALEAQQRGNDNDRYYSITEERTARMIALEWALAPWAIDPKRLQAPSHNATPASFSTSSSLSPADAASEEVLSSLLGPFRPKGSMAASSSDDGAHVATTVAEAATIAAICPFSLSMPRTPRAALRTITSPQLFAEFAASCGHSAARMRIAAAAGTEADASDIIPEDGVKGIGREGAGESPASSVPFPYSPFAWHQYSAGDKRLKADALNVVEQSMGEIAAQLDVLFESLTRRGVVESAATCAVASVEAAEGAEGTIEIKEDEASSHTPARDVTVTYFIIYVTATMGGATVQRIAEEVALGVHLRQLERSAEGDAEGERGHVVVPIIVGNAVPQSTDVGHGVPLVTFPYCRPYTLVALLQELLLLPKSVAMAARLSSPHAHDQQQQQFTVHNRIVVLSNCLGVADSAATQAQYAPRQLLKAGASAARGGTTNANHSRNGGESNQEGVAPPSLDSITAANAHLARPAVPAPLLDTPPITVAPFLFHTGHGAGGAGWLAKDAFPQFNPFTAPVDSARIDAGLMPWELEALSEYMQHFIMMGEN